jgi:hypothetical protein
LLRAKWLYTAGDPTPFTWTFAAAWCGMRSAGYVVSTIKWLIKEGYLQQVGMYRPEHGRKMALFRPGAPHRNALRCTCHTGAIVKKWMILYHCRME